MARTTNYDSADVDAAIQRLHTRPTVALNDVSLVLGTHLQTLINAYNRGTLEFPVTRIGRRWVVPTAPLLTFLGLESTQPTDTRELTSA